MHIVRMVLAGVIVGLVVRFLIPGAVPMGLVAIAVLGVAGSLAAGLAWSLVRWRSGNPRQGLGFLYSLLGAMALIFLARTVLPVV